MADGGARGMRTPPSEIGPSIFGTRDANNPRSNDPRRVYKSLLRDHYGVPSALLHGLRNRGIMRLSGQVDVVHSVFYNSVKGRGGE